LRHGSAFTPTCGCIFPNDIRGRLVREVKKKSTVLESYGSSAKLGCASELLTTYSQSPHSP
jgi:hypothetical protein